MTRGATHRSWSVVVAVGVICSLISNALAGALVQQTVLGAVLGWTNSPTIELGKEWEAIGPFPSGTREHSFLSSPIYAFLHNRSYTSSDHELAFDGRFFGDGLEIESPLCKGGRCASQLFETGDDGWSEIKYPDVRWEQLRLDQGWSGLQYQTLLRTNLTVRSTRHSQRLPLRIELVQGTEFALVSRDRPNDPVVWYNGDIYAYAETVSSSRKQGELSSLAREIMVEEGEYVVLVRAMYEIRMFGDPGGAKPGPVIKFRFGIELGRRELVEHVGELDTVADLVEGIYMGEVMGVGLKKSVAHEGIAEVVGVRLSEGSEELVDGAIGIEMFLKRFTLAGGQTRILSLSILQSKPLPQAIKHLNITLMIASGRKDDLRVHDLTIRLRLRHLPHWSASRHPIRFTHLTATSPTWAVLLPPSSPEPYASESQQPTLLALHGAGVLADSTEWVESIPERPKGWAVLPTGLTEWGMDWHGISMESALEAVRCARRLVGRLRLGKKMEDGDRAWHFSEKTIVMGHSNGGQGAWHLASRYPEEFVGVIPAAGYLKIQDYVPYLSWGSAHFADPAIMAILHSALTPYDDDLYASNLARLPVLAVHGEEDDNVPVYHSRVHTDLIDTWRRIYNSSGYEEVAGKSHWWPDVFRSDAVDKFLVETSGQSSSAAELDSLMVLLQEGFTVTTANPQESGGLGGIRIVELETPGRLARIEVKPMASAEPFVLRFSVTNVKRFIISSQLAQLFSHFEIERRGRWLPVDLHGCDVTKGACLFTTQTGMMEMIGSATSRSYGPMIRILSGTGPLLFVVGTSSAGQAVSASIAKRLAHDILVYYRLDTEILTDDGALRLQAAGLLGDANIVVIGSPRDNLFARWMLANSPSPISFHPDGTFQLQDGLFYEQSTGLLTLQPHPSAPSGLACIIAGTDEDGLELAARLFPIRTGVPVPEWVVVGATSKWQGAGGFLGAGFWDSDWKWSDAMSYLA